MSSVVGVGDFMGWDGACLLIGKALHVTPRHSHQAIQIVFGYTGPVGLRGGNDGEWTRYPLGMIPSRQPHAMDATNSTYNVVIFVEPETRVGRALAERYLGDGMASIDDVEVTRPAADVFSVWLSHAGKPAVIAAAQRVLHA